MIGGRGQLMVYLSSPSLPLLDILSITVSLNFYVRTSPMPFGVEGQNCSASNYSYLIGAFSAHVGMKSTTS